MTDAKKRANEKYAKTVKSVSTQFKKSDPILSMMEDIAIDNSVSLSQVVKAALKYIADNEIDISTYF